MADTLILLSLISIAPVFELRLSIPLGLMVFDAPPLLVLPVCIISNFAVSPLVYFLVEGMIAAACKVSRRIDKLYGAYRRRVIERLRPRVEKHGVWGLALFIGIPLPGSGVYTGAVGAHALGLSWKKFLLASAVGVCIAAAVVSLVVYTGMEGYFFIRYR